MVLLRKVIGDVLRARRLAQHRTLREVSTAANVSLGYLSEIERGHKEASSELLGAICEALGAGLSDVLGDVAATFALAEQMEDAFTTATADHAAHQAAGQAVEQTVEQPAELALVGAGDKLVGVGDKHVGGGDTLVADKSSGDAMVGDTDVTDGEVTVRVRSDGPLRTTLTTKRTPGPRHPETVFVV